MAGVIHNLNDRVARSSFGRYFLLEGSGHPKERKGARFTTELRGGLTTFSSMVYIISVNAIILSQTGGTCVCESTADDPICAANAGYNLCKDEIRRDLITATAGIAAISSFLMGAFANLPVGLAPGMGLNAYFAFSVVGFNGTGSITYREALAAVFLEGWIFLFLSIFGVRQWLARNIPKSLALATGTGIGLFIAFIGLQPAGGLGVLGGDYSNLVGLGGCPDQYADPKNQNTYFCLSHVLQKPTVWLGIFVGGFFTALMMMYRVRGAIVIGILLVSIISWPRPTSVTFFPYTAIGDANFDFFRKVVSFRPVRYIGNSLDYNYGKGKIWLALITFLYVDIMDTTGTLYSMARFAGVMDDTTGDFENSSIAYCVDAFCISMGALLGTSPVTAYIESSTGIADGAKTGIAAMVTGTAFFISIFFAPIFASIPSWATGGALVISGSLMIKNVLDINWSYMGDALPCFLTIILIPFTFNIAYGLIAGIIAMFILKGLPLLVSMISKDRIVPENFERREIWQKPTGGFAPSWMRRLASGNKKFWQSEDNTPAGLPTHTKETDSHSSNEKTTPPAAGHPDEGLHSEKQDK